MNATTSINLNQKIALDLHVGQNVPNYKETCLGTPQKTRSRIIA